MDLRRAPCHTQMWEDPLSNASTPPIKKAQMCAIEQDFVFVCSILPALPQRHLIRSCAPPMKTFNTRSNNSDITLPRFWPQVHQYDMEVVFPRGAFLQVASHTHFFASSHKGSRMIPREDSVGDRASQELGFIFLFSGKVNTGP